MMKGNFVISEKTSKILPLHMKSAQVFKKFEKYLNFLKMDKKNVQNWLVKNVLTEKNFSYDVEKISSQIKRKIKYLL